MIQVLDINMCVCVYMSVIDRLLMVHLIVKTFIQTIDIGNMMHNIKDVSWF